MAHEITVKMFKNNYLQSTKNLKKNQKNYGGPPRGKRDGLIQHILERENGNWMKIIA